MSVCKWAGRGNPRILPGRHGEECPNRGATGPQGDEQGSEVAEGCSGCLACPERHCVVCARVHADGACPECIAATRDDLAAIRLMCGALPTEVEHRGVNGEAMMLLGPSADPASFERRTAKLLFGGRCMHHQRGVECPDDGNTGPYRCPEKVAWIEDARDEQHPLFVLGTWEEVYRQEFDHRSDLRVTIDRAGDYLGRNLARMAECEEVPFEDFARDARGCRGHLESTLHDQAQGDVANIGCFECGSRLERKITDKGLDDVWTCQRCRRRYTHAEYNFALRAALEESA